MTTNEKPAHLKKTAGCNHDGVPVYERLIELWNANIHGRVIVHVADRLEHGERHYDGAKLTVGWPGARMELYQELLDAVAYAIAADDMPLAIKIAELAEKMNVLPDFADQPPDEGAKTSHP